MKTNEKGQIQKGNTPWNKGIKHTPETIAKISSKKRGVKQTEEHKEHIRQAQIIRVSEGRHNNYKGGISQNKEYRNWQKNQWHRRRKSASGSHTFDEWQTLKAQYDWKCPCCGKREPEISLSQDHIVPLSKGGSDNIENIQPLCLRCNITKHTKIIKY
jgi:5-methylcytosine-specific restriction endonuclease McrA